MQVVPANRGYWEVSVPTVLIKAEITEQQNTSIKQLVRQLEKEDLAFEIMATEGTWGLFAGLAAAPFDDIVVYAAALAGRFRLLNELRLRRDIARPDNQVGKLGSRPAQINNSLASLSDSELTWIWFDAS